MLKALYSRDRLSGFSHKHEWKQEKDGKKTQLPHQLPLPFLLQNPVLLKDCGSEEQRALCGPMETKARKNAATPGKQRHLPAGNIPSPCLLAQWLFSWEIGHWCPPLKETGTDFSPTWRGWAGLSIIFGHYSDARELAETNRDKVHVSSKDSDQKIPPNAKCPRRHSVCQ